MSGLREAKKSNALTKNSKADSMTMTGFAENMVQAGTDTLGSVPGQAIQVVLDG